MQLDNAINHQLKEIQQELSVTLIDGTYSSEQARDILLNLVGSKINFHNQEIFSLQERFGRNSAHSVKRVAELKQVRDNLIQYLNKLDNKQVNVRINSEVHIQIL
ncbi:MAG: hypothetical protein KDC92_05910 [Bacteroidetes bacterium]|nr:hypothetical protein [Bacteroidota bacterium]